jgi:hypothetical protein
VNKDDELLPIVRELFISNTDGRYAVELYPAIANSTITTITEPIPLNHIPIRHVLSK